MIQLKSVCIILGLTFVSTLAQAGGSQDHWPTWRGSTQNGVALKGNPPTQWSEAENIKWKVKIPGEGSSTPIIWGDKIFIQTAIHVNQSSNDAKSKDGYNKSNPKVPKKKRYTFSIICIDKNSGNTLWERVVREAEPHEGHHPSANYASYSPVTDGKLLWASFGSRGLYCFDLDGNPQWSTDLIRLNIKMNFGEASSPTLAGDAIVVLMDHEGQSKIAAYNKNTGEQLWEKPRDEGTSWSSPMAVQVGDKLQVITCATNYVRSYDVTNGDLIWQCSGLSSGVIPTAVTGFGNVYCASAYRGNSLMAIRLDKTGDISGSDAISWQIHSGAPYVPSPLLYDDKLYFLSGIKGVLSCYNAKTGEAYYAEQPLSGIKKVYASPLGVAGHVYIADRKGTVIVLKHGTELSIVAENKLNDVFDASPVSVGDELYLRGAKNLYCIAKS